MNSLMRFINLGDYAHVDGDERNGLKMATHHHPVSITSQEFDILQEFVIKHKVQCAFEVATAFGISAMAIGLGLKQTGGRLVTMDAYIEEQYNLSTAYIGKTGTYENADGYKSVKFLIDYFTLTDTVYATVGWSPTDVSKVLYRVFPDLGTGQLLDMVFIDALHTDEALIADFGAIRPFMSPAGAIFLHDLHCFSDHSLDVVREFAPLRLLNTKYNMGVLTKL